MTFGDLNWFMLTIWIVLLVLSFMYKEKQIKLTASTLGLILSFMILAESHIFAFLFFLVNVICFLQGASQK